ncbi:uncharacterized protein LOC142329173 [Lycorma delicatula]|uniref:uncharacterized protein LOC142329173 n=1 Tax=Lycorma delicatula TaxID=130591 RepID=UPI003F5172E7
MCCLVPYMYRKMHLKIYIGFILWFYVVPARLSNVLEALKVQLKETGLSDTKYDSSELMKVIKSPSFIDKSSFIKYIFKEDYTNILITAPDGFGKTTNINMLKTFLEIELNEDGYPTKNIKKPIRYTKNYNLFNRNLLKIRNAWPCVNKHFGRHPVILVNFKIFKGCPYESTNDMFKLLIHRTYQQYGYLMKSKYLSVKQKTYFNIFYNENTCSNLTLLQINDGLYFLTGVMSKHFRKQVVVLIDEYDTHINNAIATSNEKYLGFIIEFQCEFVSHLIKKNKFVKKSIVAGVSFMAGGKLCCCNLFKEYRFLDNHIFVKYFGVTLNEIYKLFNKYNISNEQSSIFFQKASGYIDITKKKSVFSTSLVQNYLKYNSFSSYSQMFGYVYPLKNAFYIPLLKYHIEKLIQGFNVHAVTSSKSKILFLRGLQYFILKTYKQKFPVLPYLFFTFLLELGYLSYNEIRLKVLSKPPEMKLSTLRIANDLIKEELINNLNEQYQNEGLHIDNAETCANILNSINIKSEKENFIRFRDSLKVLLKSMNVNNSTFCKNKIHSIIFTVISKSYFRIAIDWSKGITMKIPDFILFNKNYDAGVVVKVNYNRSRTEILSEIIDKDCYNNYKNKTIFNPVIKNVVLIGINIKENMEISLTYTFIINNLLLKDSVYIE